MLFFKGNSRRTVKHDLEGKLTDKHVLGLIGKSRPPIESGHQTNSHHETLNIRLLIF